VTTQITPQDGADAIAMLDKEARAQALKLKQANERKADKETRAAAAKAPAKKERAPRSVKTTPKATVKTVKAPKKKASNGAPSKAERVRVLLEQGKNVKQIAEALDDVSWSYAWDVAAAWEKKTGKTVIASHAKKAAPSRRERKAKAPVVSQAAAG
jgi:hypothetical protein